MTKKTTITINGRLYDAITGMPIAATAASTPVANESRATVKAPTRSFNDIGPRPQTTRTSRATPAKTHLKDHQPSVAQTIHSRPQKSQTLYRQALKKPVAEQPTTSLHSSEIAQHERSPMISRFGSNVTHHPHLNPKPKVEEPAEIAPAQMHPTVAKVLQGQQIAEAESQLSGKALKEQLIKNRLAEVDEAPAKKEKTRWFARRPRLATILTSTLALLILGGYITYMNLPIISMKVAASRAGVNATMPGYHPDGYGLNGPITYAPGEVTINYKSTTNDSTFKLTQKPSTWDSQAVLDNYVTKQTETFLTFQERGIKVYTYDNKATWVNAGLLYTIEGTATLSSDQILRLATSM
jgi:hypothetical protein